MTTFLITIIALSFVFVAIGIKIILKKNGRFSGTCASQNPYLRKKNEPCGYCGKPVEECENN